MGSFVRVGGGFAFVRGVGWGGWAACWAGAACWGSLLGLPGVIGWGSLLGLGVVHVQPSRSSPSPAQPVKAARKPQPGSLLGSLLGRIARKPSRAACQKRKPQPVIGWGWG